MLAFITENLELLLWYFIIYRSVNVVYGSIHIDFDTCTFYVKIFISLYEYYSVQLTTTVSIWLQQCPTNYYSSVQLIKILSN